ncbi:MAG TPA: glutathione S-transferase family protein [Usitatibacter sp.]|jgi:glutathione S-transferase|nr:glutathione S-transferase family protein [Usitatibacter sp.]
MILLGMLDSPYVRRVAISMKRMGLAFEHRPLSVFRTFEEFRAINPVVKAPTLVCDDGAVLMDSTLILDHLESLVEPARRLMPSEIGERREALRLIGLAMAACEKCVQIVYEHNQRPAEKVHEPWLERVVSQANAGFAELERAAAHAKPWLQGERFGASDVAVACTWRFSQFYDAREIPAARYPALAAYCARAEALPEFASTPLD